MNRFESLRPVTRRQLRVHYLSPLVCHLHAESSGSGSGSSAVSMLEILPTYRLGGPTLSALAEGADVSLSWTAVEGAFAYVIYRATSPEGPFALVTAGLLDTSFVDTPENPGTYYYRVTGIEPNYGETEASNTEEVTV